MLKRIYDPAGAGDGYRVLVDRLWPRGMTKEKARIDLWAKEMAPSHELRKWFHADRTKWAEFKRKYLAELAGHKEELQELAARAAKGEVTLLYGSTDPERNHAVVLAECIEGIMSRRVKN
jgi:uncharacterized protein YeaO (DUF488 family)